MMMGFAAARRGIPAAEGLQAIRCCDPIPIGMLLWRVIETEFQGQRMSYCDVNRKRGALRAYLV